MRSFAILTWLALGGSALSAPSLGDDLEIRNVNECNAVTVIISILSQYRASATSFCSSFISIPIKTVTSTNIITSTPKPSTVTQTMIITPMISVTATTTITPTSTFIRTVNITAEEANDLDKRKNQPLPIYMSAFHSSEISSACSCLSIHPSTTTVKSTSTAVFPVPTITIISTVLLPPVTTTVSTVTVTAATTVIVCDMPQPTFILKLASSVLLNGTDLIGTYGSLDISYPAGYRVDRIAFNGFTDPNSAELFYFSPYFLVSFETGFLAVRLAGEEGVQPLEFEDAELAAPDVPATCSIAGGVLACNSGNATVLQLCPGVEVTTNDLFIGPTVGGACEEVVLDVLQVCIPPSGYAK